MEVNMMHLIQRLLLSVLIAMLAVPESTEAYIGPGAGISAIGTVLALIATILLAIVGFIWYPAKRLLSRMKTKHDRNISS
jgi:hypothetical protein